jgi:hypothetical protein
VEVILSWSERRVPTWVPLVVAERDIATWHGGSWRGGERGEGEDRSCRDAKQDGNAVAEDDSGSSGFVCGRS